MKKIVVFIILTFVIINFISCDRKQVDQFIEKDGNNKEIIDTNKMYTIVDIESQNSEPYLSSRKAMLETLKENGYEEGKNIKIIYKNISNDQTIGEEFIKESTELDPDLFFIQGSVSCVSAKNTLFKKKHNVVFACVTDPVGIGVIEDFYKPPKYNFTGVSYPVPVESRLNFIKEIIPEVKKIGLIYADMPQSHSYKNWLEKALKKPNLSDLEITYRIVPLITGDKGTKEMAQMAKDFALELNDSVDVFMTPNDQMGISEDFIRNVSENSTKPLIGISRNNVTERWGATAVIYPSHLSMGRQSGKMIIRLLEGASIKDIPAEEPEENGFAFDLNKVKEFGLTIPMKFIELAGEQNIIRSDSN